MLRALEQPKARLLIRKSESDDIVRLTEIIQTRDIENLHRWIKYHREIPLDDLPLVRIQEMCRERGISYAWQDKSNLIERILSHDAAKEAPKETGDA